MSSGDQRRQPGRAHWPLHGSPRQELTAALLLGALGAGLAFLATRQGWAEVRTILPKPLPAGRVTVTGAGLVPYADALVVAGVATLAAVLATRGLLRRLTGVLLAAIGVGLAASAFTLSKASAVSAASSSISPETAPAGSVTAGSGTASSTAPDVSGAATHVVFAAAGWQALVVAGAVLIVAAGILIAWRARQMAVMSSRYESSAGAARRSQDGPHPAAAGMPSDSASIWEALSRGDDPTSAGSRPSGA